MVDSVYYKENINGNYKMKQNMQNQKYMNCIMMIKSQNILATLMIFLSQLKTFRKNFIQKRQCPKLPLVNFSVTSEINNITIARQTIF